MSELPPLNLNLDREFPIRQNWIYLNHAAVAPLPARVGDAVKRFVEQA